MSARITWVGHSTVLLDLDGVRLLTDPVLRARLTHLRRVAPVDQSALRGVDAILVSHVHYDHLDLPSSTGSGARSRCSFRAAPAPSCDAVGSNASSSSTWATTWRSAR